MRIYEKLWVDMSRDDMILLAREWFDVYGEPPLAWQWNAAELRRRDHKLHDAFVSGGWPTVSMVRKEFGSFTDFLIVAGFYPRQTRALWRNTSRAKRSYYLREAIKALKAQLPTGPVESLDTATER